MFLSFSNPRACNGMLRPLPTRPTCLPPSFLIPHVVCVCVCTCVVFAGVCSAWAVGRVVVMESVLCHLWAGLQDTNQEVCERRRGRGLRTARHSDQTLQHCCVSWLVPSPFTWLTQLLSLSLPIRAWLCLLFDSCNSQKFKAKQVIVAISSISKHVQSYFVLFKGCQATIVGSDL